MNILFFIIIFVIGYSIFFIISNKIHINYKSFFRKGFKKIDDDFGLYCYVGKQRKR